MRATALAIAISLAAPVIVYPQSKPSPIFTIRSDEFWLNLHHFLYVLGRTQLRMGDAARPAVADAPLDQRQQQGALTADEKDAWATAVAFYVGGLSRKDVIFDAPLPMIGGVLAAAREQPTLANVNVDPELRAALESAAPVYRKAWWPAHRASNRAWQSSIESLVNQHGANIVAFVTRAYELSWPAAGYTVHATAYANWAGAYSTDGGLIVASSRDNSMQGLNGFETVVHESMHQWDQPMLAALQAHATPMKTNVPRDLTHALIFYTAGYAVQQFAPQHVPVADALGIWSQRLSGSPLPAQRLKPPLEEIWKPHLDGRTDREIALAALVARVSVRPGP